tara:strand:- start:8630 stop:9313 length:684 start_codon:yes stop_codon:yes gene_type:complete
MTDEPEDLMGDPPKPDPHAAMKTLPPREPREEIRTNANAGSLKMTGAMQGVTVYWLSQVFGLTPETVRMRLADVTPESVSGKSNRYRVKDAAEVLVDPKIDIEKYMKRMRPTDLPPNLQKEIWDARLKRQKWEAMAGDQWHTNDVMEVLSDVFSIIKSTIQLWPDTLERTLSLSDEQRELLVVMGDTLQDEVYQGIKKMASLKTTKSALYDLDKEDAQDDEDEEDLL